MSVFEGAPQQILANKIRPSQMLVEWLVEQALPMWSQTGVDRQGGGFFEKINLQGQAVEEPRRARVVARQIYVFATTARRGWLPGADADVLVEHGLHFLLNKMRLPGGNFAAAVWPDGTVVNGSFDLYEQAFVLFALAAAYRDHGDHQGGSNREALRSEAEALLQCLRSRWQHPLMGFEESAPRTLPLKSNPHMHLLEAALAWADLSSGPAKEVWETLADELVGLCLTHFIDAKSGALREYFDGDWQPMPGAQGCVVEPGHQFEWSWLLMRWAGLQNDTGQHQRALTAAQRLLEIGETHGVDPARGVVVNELDADLQITDGVAKLWPQTERIKAWHAAADLKNAAGDAPLIAADKRAEAIQGLSDYFLTAPAGLWHEQMKTDGSFVLENCRASSLYHIVCAIDTLQDTVQDTQQSGRSG